MIGCWLDCVEWLAIMQQRTSFKSRPPALPSKPWRRSQLLDRPLVQKWIGTACNHKITWKIEPLSVVMIVMSSCQGVKARSERESQSSLKFLAVHPEHLRATLHRSFSRKAFMLPVSADWTLKISTSRKCRIDLRGPHWVGGSRPMTGLYCITV